MIARIGSTPRHAEPVSNDGRWVYVEVDVEIEGACKEVQHTLRGWVNKTGLRSRHFDEWLTDELLTKLTGLARVERFVRRTRDASADFTSPLLSALCSAVLLA